MSSEQTAYHRTANVHHGVDVIIRWRRLQVLSMFKICHRMKRTSPDTKHEKEYERTETFTVN